MAKLKFNVYSPGDTSVGIWPLHSEISIDDNVVWDKDMIEEFKKFFAEMYDTTVDLVGVDATIE